MGFQDFEQKGDPAHGAARLGDLRRLMKAEGLDGWMVPRADAYQGEYVADSDARLLWLTGFSGSAGFAVITAAQAGVFIDGRYRLQVRSEVDLAHFTPVNWPETGASEWLIAALPEGGRVGFDPWMHTHKEITALRSALEAANIGLVASPNLVDRIWPDRPRSPVGRARAHPICFAGEDRADKRARIAEALREAGQATAVLTLPDSISWLLNIRGRDIPRNPVVQSFAVIDDKGMVQLFADPAKFSDDLRTALGNEVSIIHPSGFVPALQDMPGPVRIDPAGTPEQIFALLAEVGTKIVEAADPAILPKAVKNDAELHGMRAAHLRDAVAVVRLLAWLETDGGPPNTEIDVVRKLEQFRVEAGIHDISFDTICGSGPNGAIVHYRVTNETNRGLHEGDLLLVDSGGQYVDGTTDITRTVALGPVDVAAMAPFTRVLRGMIALSRAQFPCGVAGRDLDALARQFLWQAGQDYDHGTGHGVGAALCVHEGPIRFSRASTVPLEPGMILSNEPGYYREGAFGIRIENLLAITPVDSPDGRDMLGCETLTWVPIDRRLIEPAMMAPDEIAWLDAYHAGVREKIGPLLPEDALDWLNRATLPLKPLPKSIQIQDTE